MAASSFTVQADSRWPHLCTVYASTQVLLYVCVLMCIRGAGGIRGVGERMLSFPVTLLGTQSLLLGSPVPTQPLAPCET